MAILNWHAFKYKFNGYESKAFESLAYQLFCFEHDQSKGIFRYKNQTGIETEPIMVKDELIGFQAKYYETKISNNKKDIEDSLEKAKGKNENIKIVYLYLNQEFSESKGNGVKNPKYKTEIESFASSKGITIVWQVPSNFEIILTDPLCKKIREYYFPELSEAEREDSVAPRFYPEIKQHLAGRYKSRIQQKLASRQPVNLRQLPSDYGTSEESLAIFEQYAEDRVQEGIVQYFETASGRLLLVGKPGSGKTILLLQLVLHLLANSPQHLPAIVNLATWNQKYCSLDAWLHEILPTELGVNKALAKRLVQEDRLVLLFDGLDEVKAEDRPSCLKAIDNYGRVAERQYVISSRMEEYREIPLDAPVNLQIEVGPLSKEQLKAELSAQRKKGQH